MLILLGLITSNLAKPKPTYILSYKDKKHHEPHQLPKIQAGK